MNSAAFLPPLLSPSLSSFHVFTLCEFIHFSVCVFIMETWIIGLKFVNKFTIVVSSIILKCVCCIARKAFAESISIRQFW